MKQNITVLFLAVWQYSSAGSRDLDSGGQILHRNSSEKHTVHVSSLHHDLHRMLRNHFVFHRSIWSIEGWYITSPGPLS